MAIQLRSHCRKTLPNPSIHRFFSTPSNGEEDDKTSPTTSTSPAPSPSPSPSPAPAPSPSSFSSSISSIRASLRQSSPPPSRSRNPNYPPPHPPPRPSNVSTLEEIRKSLGSFRSRYAGLPSPEGHDTPSQPSVSFQDVYNRSVIGQGNADASSDAKKPAFQSIREKLRQYRESSPAAGRDRRAQGDSRPSSVSLSALKESLKLKPSEDSARSSDSLRISLFGRETAAAKTEAESQTARTDFLKTYDVKELGRKLRELRPPEAETKKKDWFSLEELNERLKKLREIEDKEPRESGFYGDLRDSLVKLRNAQQVNSRQRSMQKLALLGQFGGQVSPSFMLSVPKEHLVEKYFHPDNMSSAEKLKLELKRVREEFKMSESDCGSSRVQVALLTTKIKHLSSVLHKKDKHSRKGLLAMVQKRKKLLKYLRRTDWDSYCLVLSKFDLRDNPDFKNLKI